MGFPTIPRHVAIVMDGNGRWAKKRLLPRIAGHQQGVESLKRCALACQRRGVGVLTVFAFSSENWQRPSDEVGGLMDLFAVALAREIKTLHAQGVCLRFVGDRLGLSQRVLLAMEQAQALTQDNRALTLNVCFNYGGRWDIVQAAARLARRGGEFTEAELSAEMALAHVPDPDLVIRTGGEVRISNFLLWQSAYAEFFFSDVLWPDFDEVELDRAMSDYAQRQRRFGKTGDQVSAPGDSPC